MRSVRALPVLVLACAIHGAAHATPVEMIVNGGFESGSTGWTFSQLASNGCDTQWAILMGSAGVCNGGVTPPGGSFALHSAFDGAGPRTNVAAQSFLLPAAPRSATLRWTQGLNWSWFGSQPRVESVRVKDSAGTTLATPFVLSTPSPSSGSSPFVTHSFDITAQVVGRSGQQVQVAWELFLPEAFQGPSEFILDDVSVRIEFHPTITSAAASPSSPDEGVSASFSAAANDLANDPLTYTWDWGDGSPTSVGPSRVHSYADDGTYNVRLIVADAFGGSALSVVPVVVNNVAPQITSTAPSSAIEGTAYTYLPVATDPGALDLRAWSAPTGPSTATVSSTNGAVSWTPTYAEALAGSASFTLEVADDDGGVGSQTFTVTVAVRDDDADAMSDTWESLYGLDPADPTDAGGDLDADGLSNLSEYRGNLDPTVFDGPTAPVAASPLGGVDTESAPELLVVNASDPQGDPLSYTFEVYEDVALTSLVASEAGLPEGPGQTAWFVTSSLSENQRHWWRASANDGNVDGPWSDAGEFRVNTVNDPPSMPVAVYPVDDLVGTDLPRFEWVASVDPDDATGLTYDVEVWDQASTQITAVVGVTTSDVNGTWLIDEPLDPGVYLWRVFAVDPHGLRSMTEDADFQIVTDQLPPEGIAFTSPTDGSRIESTSPVLVASAGGDPEGNAITYRFEVDTAPTFDSADYATVDLDDNGTDTLSWNLDDDGVVLPENALAYARVRGIDAFGHASPPDTISFYVTGENEPPTGLALTSPPPGSLLPEVPALACSLAVDPEGTAVSYEFVLATDEALADVIETSGPVSGGTTEATWTPTSTPAGEVFWSARAIDADGVASAWAPPNTFTIDEGGLTEVPALVCGCNGARGAVGVWPLALALLLARRRRA